MSEDKVKEADAEMVRCLLALRDAEMAEAVAREAYRKARQQYAETRPLTPAEHQMLLDRVAAGEPLCCEAGSKWLNERLPPVWADAINHWAYEALGCGPRSPSEITDDVQRTRRLKLDKLP